MNAELETTVPQATHRPPGAAPRDEAGKTRSAGGVYAPRVNVLETEDSLFLYADLPGVNPSDVTLDWKGGELVLQARCSPRHEGKRLIHAEYGVGDFYRAFRIAEQVETGKIEARMKDGVLEVRIPKADAVRPKRIAVKAG